MTTMTSAEQDVSADQQTMRALTIKQPWASLIMRGVKDVENRSWTTSYRGPLLIHAGKAYDSSCPLVWLTLADPFCNGLTHGAILGMVDVVDCVCGFDSPFTDHDEFQMVLANPVVFETPIECRGKLGLWRPSAETWNAIEEQTR